MSSSDMHNKAQPSGSPASQSDKNGSTASLAPYVPLKTLVEQAAQVLQLMSSSTYAVVPPASAPVTDGSHTDAGETDTGAAAAPTVVVPSEGPAESVSLLTQPLTKARLAAFVDQANEVKRLLDAYDEASRSRAASTTTSTTMTPVSEITAPLSGLRAALTHRQLDDVCQQKVRLDSSGEQIGLPLASREAAAEMVAKQMQPLALLKSQFAALRFTPGFAAASAASQTTAATSASTNAPLTFATPASLAGSGDGVGPEEDGEHALVPLVASSQTAACDVVARDLNVLVAMGEAACDAFVQSQLGDHVDVCATPAGTLPASTHVLVRDLARWLAPYMRLVQELLERPSLEAITDVDREQLRRISFDVLELQHQQEQAVTDGDMTRSEDIYLEQVQVLETMETTFSELEVALDRYRQQWGEHWRDALTAAENEWAEKLRPVMDDARARQKSLREDLDVLQNCCETVRRRREAHKLDAAQYRVEWARLYQRNVAEQRAVYDAIHELERRLKQLGEEQHFLVHDRIEAVEVERARCADADMFTQYAKEREAALQWATQRAEQLCSGLDAHQRAIRESVDRAHQYQQAAVDARVGESMVNLQRARLSQFRQLYLTLGDLSFKKARHAEEVQKKVDYYTLQQEVAMDTFNPKAKTFSRTRQQWEGVYEEVQKQLGALQEEAQKKLQDFEPTEQFLIEAGIPFRSPRDELEERNAARQQRLIEYKKIMEANALASNESGGGGVGAPLQLTERAAGRKTGQPSTPSSSSLRGSAGNAAATMADGALDGDAMNAMLDRELRTTHTRYSQD